MKVSLAPTAFRINIEFVNKNITKDNMIGMLNHKRKAEHALSFKVPLTFKIDSVINKIVATK